MLLLQSIIIGMTIAILTSQYEENFSDYLWRMYMWWMCLKNSFHYEYIKDINVIEMTRDYAKITKTTVITSGTSIMKKRKKTYLKCTIC